MLEELAKSPPVRSRSPRSSAPRSYSAGSALELRRQTAGSVGAEIPECGVNGLIDNLPDLAARACAAWVSRTWVREARAVFEAGARAEHVVKGIDGAARRRGLSEGRAC
jgi:hypothetical protein